jgi:DNA-binding MarR family transcriptional regulator
MADKLILKDGALRALDALRGVQGAVTMAELNSGLDNPIAVAHLTSLVKNGLVSTEQVEREVIRVSKVNSYTYTGKDFDEADKLTDGMARALDVISKATSGTLAELNAGLEQPIGSAHMTGLVRKGYVSTEQVERDAVRVSKVNAYSVTDAGLDFIQA